MIKKTNILLVSLIAMMSAGAARAEATTKEYVDSQDNVLAARIKLQNEYMGMVRDWVNPKDTNGNRTTLETDAKHAYGAINELNTALAGKQDTIDNEHKLPAANVDGLANVATSGDYEDLTNKPTLATVATTGDYGDLTNKPTVPAQVQSDWAQTDSNEVDFIKNKPTLANVATSGDYEDLTNTPNLATVATSGDYGDLTNKPSIPTVDAALNAESNNAIANSAVAGAVKTLQNTINYNNESVGVMLNNKQNKLDATAETGNLVGTNGITVSTPSEGDNAGKVIIGGPSLATVATTGDYGDLTNKPTIPTVDTALNGESDNAIANSAVAAALANKANAADVYTKSETYTKNEVTQKITQAELSGSVTVDDELSSTSENPVQNLVVTNALGEKITKGEVPSPGQYVLGFVDGVQTYIKIVDANGN